MTHEKQVKQENYQRHLIDIKKQLTIHQYNIQQQLTTYDLLAIGLEQAHTDYRWVEHVCGRLTWCSGATAQHKNKL